MTVELWYGSKPNNPGEQSVLVELYDFFKPHKDHFLLLTNFHAGISGEIDLMIIKKNALLIVELKHCWSKIVGTREGKWEIQGHDGATYPLGNPYKQIRRRSNSWNDWCQKNISILKKELHPKIDLHSLNPNQYILIYPEIHTDSEIDIGVHPVKAMGITKFRTEVVVRTSKVLSLNRKNMKQIPKLLKLRRWHIEARPHNRKTQTLKNDDYKPAKFRMLVARGHRFSGPTLHITRDSMVIGRDGSCDFTINSSTVSGKHALIMRSGDNWIVKDLDSKNGTFVCFNGDPECERRIDQMNAVKNGSIIRFGEADFTFLVND